MDKRLPLKIRFFFKGKAREKITADILFICRGLFFECNAAIGQKDNF